MAYRVYQGHKPADTKGYPEIKEGLGWDNSIFLDKRAAEVYAYCWAYPVTLAEAETMAGTMEVGEEYDFGYTADEPVLMKIVEI